jgi:hypothetical protein
MVLTPLYLPLQVDSLPRSSLHMNGLPRPTNGASPHAEKQESEFEKLARLIKEEGEDIRTDVHDQIGGLRKEMHEGFAAINRRLDQIIQMQLDERAARIKN